MATTTRIAQAAQIPGKKSFTALPNRGCKDALRQVDGLLKEGYVYVLDADLKSYFDTIPHDRLMTLIEAKVSDARILSLVEMFLKQSILDGGEELTPEQGSPQGAVLSPLLSNIHLDPLDHLMALNGFAMVRYADDFVIMCRSQEDAESALVQIQEWTGSAGLTLHPVKTRIVNAIDEGFDLLGYHFERAGNDLGRRAFRSFETRFARRRSVHPERA